MRSVRELSVLAYFFVGSTRATTIPDHAKFLVDDGVIRLEGDRSLRFNVAGGIEEGNPLILYPCAPHSHEVFDISEGVIRLHHAPSICLNAEAGANAGANIVTWHCPQPGAEVHENEEFVFADNGQIHLKLNRNMCLNVPEGRFSLGTKLILFPCQEDATDNQNEIFEFHDGLIRVKAKPTFHLNIEGANLSASNNVVLWECQPNAHEVFEFTDMGQIRMKNQKNMCVNAEGGLRAGARMIVWPCSGEETVPPNEHFAYDAEAHVIYAVDAPSLGFNVKEADKAMGGEIILWPLSHGDEL